MAITATIGVNANLADSATGLNVTGTGSAFLNISAALGVQDVTLPAGTLNQLLPLPLGLTAAQFVFVAATACPDLQLTLPGMTYGTSTSGASAGITTLATDTLILNLDGDGAQTITFAANTTGAGVAADLQAKVRALAALKPVNALAYAGFTAVYTGGQYVLTSGVLGTGSSVVVTGGTAAAGLKLGTGNGGTEVVGSGGVSQQIPLQAGTVVYNTSGVYITSAAGGAIQFAVGG